jgi:hypothetical protein
LSRIQARASSTVAKAASRRVLVKVAGSVVSVTARTGSAGAVVSWRITQLSSGPWAA